MSQVKKNVSKFNNDVEKNNGYIYTINNKYSSYVSNKRITVELFKNIHSKINSIIDIGCGDGMSTNEIKCQFPHIPITGIEPSYNASKIANEKYKDIEFINASIYEIDILKNKQYDLSLFRGVLHHLENPIQAIKNAKELSNEMLIIEPNGNNYLLKIIEKTSKYHIEHEEQSFSTKQLLEFCAKNNWKIKSIKYIGFVPFFFPTLFSKIIYLFQPLLERIPLINKYFSAQIVIYCTLK